MSNLIKIAHFPRLDALVEERIPGNRWLCARLGEVLERKFAEPRPKEVVGKPFSTSSWIR
jgi:hypothetical protein